MDFTVEQLPSVNATLNALAAILLLLGWVQIKTGRERAHKISMLSAFTVSIAFLTCYLVYHFQVGSVPFQGPPAVRPVYYSILITHVILAATVPVLAGITIYLGLKDRRAKHRRLARWTFPIWLYVSITGVVIYVMLYHLYPASGEKFIIERPSGVFPAAEISGAD
ncbi:MAG: DUF420 domain-containing protein [Planctomycetia bacterium]|nr:DUF420 domain-containing protein [Planctomycetia bacterium]